MAVTERRLPGTSSGHGSPEDIVALGSPNSDEDSNAKCTSSLLLQAPPPPLTSYNYPLLPITKDREKLISLIENNSVVIIRGATGSGKTTQLPQYIMDHYNEKRKPCKVVVTQPRKIGASSIARWVAQERKCTLGDLVGYQVGLKKVATERTKLIYMTTGVLLQKLVGSKSLTEFTHIFIDEVPFALRLHLRNLELDFLLLVVRKLLYSNSWFVKVILMSATINCKEFAEYFSTPVFSQMSPAYVFEVQGAPYTVEEYYLDDLHSLCPHRVVNPSPEDPTIAPEMYNLAISLIQSFDKMEAKDWRWAEHSLSTRGSVLVFLPGLAEINYMQDELATLVRKRLQVYPLHSTVTLEEQNGVFLVPVPGYRKIILSTNIAESSVTVPDVKYVIDFCLERQLVCDKESSYQSLHLVWSSKANCNQRRGRAGRVSKGYCYRLVTKEFWKREIPDHAVPEMLRASLASTVLRLKLLDMGDPRTLLSTALSPPKLGDIEKTILQLKEVSKHLSVKNRFDGELTFLGRVLAHLPVDLHLGKMIVLGHVFGCLEECLIIAASMSLKSYFVLSSVQRLAGYRSKLAFTDGVPSDFIAFVNAFKAWHITKSKGEFRNAADELKWGKENCIQIKRIREVAELLEDLKQRVSQLNMHVREKPDPGDYESLHKQRFILQIVIAGAFYPNYFTVGEIDEELASRELFWHDPKTTVLVRNIPPYGFLYYKQLQSLFRQCGQVKAISFDSSRAYVEFNKPSSLGTGVLPEVSLALLMARQRIPLELFVYSTEEVEAKAGSRTVSHLRYSRVNVDLQNHSVYPVSILSNLVDPNQFPSNPQFMVSITEVVEVGHFWGFQADEADLEKQHQLTADINGRKLQPLSGLLYPNQLCLAPFSEDRTTSQYFRARILHVWGSDVEVFFVDYGNVSHVSASSLRELPEDLLEHPFQAREFQIAGIRPSAQSVILGGRWSSRARKRFISLVSGHGLVASLFSILHGVMHIDLFISADSISTSVVDIMVQEGHALKAEETFESKQNHEELQVLYKDLQNDTFMPNSVSTSYMVQKKEEKQLIDSLLEAFSKTSWSTRKSRVCVGLRILVVNSVAVKENPQDVYQRVLVAGRVSVTAAGSHILLKETTLMPSIAGLPALLCMLFAPVMELRTNEERTCFTGALCGLGWSVHTHEPILPEHDIEITFDVRFDVEDITEVTAHSDQGVSSCCCRRYQFSREPLPSHRLSVKRVCVWQGDPSQKKECLRNDGRTKGVVFQLHPIPLLNV
uniref:ATP-dependent RNA helicase TDRD9 n=1 Tax=Scleropages formosus TaxID=113540 RepID=A0A8C9WQN2_SCLFO